MTERKTTNFAMVLAIWVAGLGSAAQFGKVAVIFGALVKHYAGSASSIGLMVSIVGLAGIVFGATAGLLAYRFGYRRVLLGGMALGALLSALEALLPGYYPMMGLRLLEGFSQIAIVVTGPVLMAQHSAERHHGFVMSLWASFMGVGFAMAGAAEPWLTALGGISGMFLGHALYMAVMAMVLAALVPQDPASARINKAGSGSLWQQHLDIYRSPRVAAPPLGFFFYTTQYVALFTVLPQMVPAKDTAWVATIMPMSSIVISLLLSVALLRVMPAVRLVQAAFLVTLLAAAALWGAWDTGWIALGLILLVATALGVVQSASFAAIPQLNASAADRGKASGAMSQMGNFGTTIGTPILVALTTSMGATGIVVFVLPLSLCGIGLHSWMAARRRGTPQSAPQAWHGAA